MISFLQSYNLTLLFESFFTSVFLHTRGTPSYFFQLCQRGCSVSDHSFHQRLRKDLNFFSLPEKSVYHSRKRLQVSLKQFWGIIWPYCPRFKQQKFYQCWISGYLIANNCIYLCVCFKNTSVIFPYRQKNLLTSSKLSLPFSLLSTS